MHIQNKTTPTIHDNTHNQVPGTMLSPDTSWCMGSGSHWSKAHITIITIIAQPCTAKCMGKICDQMIQWVPPPPDVQIETPCNWHPNCVKPLDEGPDGTQSPWVHHHQGRWWSPLGPHPDPLSWSHIKGVHLGPTVQHMERSQSVCVAMLQIRFSLRFQWVSCLL